MMQGASGLATLDDDTFHRAREGSKKDRFGKTGLGFGWAPPEAHSGESSGESETHMDPKLRTEGGAGDRDWKATSAQQLEAM